VSRRPLDGRLARSIGPWLICGLAVLACATPPSVELLDESPNVLLIVIDDLRPDLGVYGHPQVHSPGIDSLAASGMRFERAYAQYPACNPSRTSLLTGLRPGTTGIFDNKTLLSDRLPDFVTLPGLFRDHGYFTASVGKVFHGSGRKNDGRLAESWDLEAFPRGARRRDTSGPPGTRGHVGRYRWRIEVDSDRDGDLQDSRVAKRAVQVLEQARDRPFFIAVGLSATHPHFEAPARFFDLYPTASIAPPRQPATATAALLSTIQGWSDEESAAFTSEQKQELIRAYWACVSFVDEQVEKILAALERLELADSTIVVLVSDHGYHLGEHGWWSKRTLYEASTRVPLIIRVPGMATAGQGSPRVVELIDLFPTLTDLAGIEPPAALEGRSLIALLEEPERADWEGTAHSEVSLGRIAGRSVRTRDYRYTEWNGAHQAVELFDYSRGGESDNVASQAQYDEIRRELAALLE
jgi:uncharacterized sulfatase